MGSTIDGLVSGLNTTQIIQQLMAVERLPEQALTQGKTDASNRASVLQNLNSLVAALQTAATAFAPDSVLTSAVWKSTTAASSSSAIATAVTTSAAVPGSATFAVNQVATAGSAVSTWAVGSSSSQVATANSSLFVSKGAASVGFTSIDGGTSLGSTTHKIAVSDLGGGNFDIVIDGSTTTHNYVSSGTTGSLTLNGDNGLAITVSLSGSLKVGSASTTSVATGTGSLADVARAISTSSAGVQATAVGVSASAYKLQLTSTTTGAASDVTLNPGAFSANGYGDLTQLTAGQDTVLHVGTGAGAYDVTSSTTTVSTLLPGVSITALKADPTTPVTVTVASDSSGMADKMQALVDAANAALSFIDRNSAYDTNTKTAQPLLGNSMVSTLRQKIADVVIGTSASTPAMNGVSVQKDGSIAFDRQKFLDSYAADPAKVQATMTTMAQSLYDQAKQASDPYSGYVTAQITAEQASVKDYTDQITAFEDRMTLKQQSLQTQYAALETALGQMQSQSQWLAGQLSSLMTPSTSSSK